MSYVDISVPISPSLPCWPGAPAVWVERRHDMALGEVATDSSFSMNVHTGTHVDAPAHFVRDGRTVDSLPLDILIGPVLVAGIPAEIRAIGYADLEALSVPSGTERLLFRTGNSRLWQEGVKEFREDFAALTRDGAEWIVERGVRLVGIDYLSIQRFADGPETHQILLEAEVVVLEGLNLADVVPGEYELICLPIKLEGLEGAPARAVLRPLGSCNHLGLAVEESR